MLRELLLQASSGCKLRCAGMGFAMWLRLATLQREPAKTWRGCDPADRLFPDSLAKAVQVCCEPVAEAAQRKFGPGARSDLASRSRQLSHKYRPSFPRQELWLESESCGCLASARSWAPAYWRADFISRVSGRRGPGRHCNSVVSRPTIQLPQRALSGHVQQLCTSRAGQRAPQ